VHVCPLYSLERRYYSDVAQLFPYLELIGSQSRQKSQITPNIILYDGLLLSSVFFVASSGSKICLVV
jgi:hypothetical protein